MSAVEDPTRRELARLAKNAERAKSKFHGTRHDRDQAIRAAHANRWGGYRRLAAATNLTVARIQQIINSPKKPPPQ